MFTTGLKKIAIAIVTMTPEEYYSHVGEKDPYVGAVVGSLAGAATGAKKKRTAKAALIGAGLGGASGATIGHLGGKALRSYQASKVRKMTGNLNLRSTPSRSSYSRPSNEGE